MESLHYTAPTIRESCNAAPGYGGGDMRSTNMTNVEYCRFRADDRPIIRPVARVKVIAGLVDGARSEWSPERPVVEPAKPRKTRKRRTNRPDYTGMILR